MLTYEEAVSFLEGVLRMPPDWRNLLREKPLEFLTLFMKRHAIRVPFQNAYMAAVDEGHRWFPSIESIITNGLSGRGGCCINTNYFGKLVLQAIGLDAFVVRGDHYPEPIPGSGCILMVNLRTSAHSVYMVELGGAYPILEPVPMDPKRMPYRIVQAVGFPYEFREIAPGWVGKFHLQGGIMGGNFSGRKEALHMYWEMKGRELWEFDYAMLDTFTKPSYSILLQVPYMHRFFRNTEFRRLFPELPENKEKVLVTKSKTLSEIIPTNNGKPKLAGILKSSNTQNQKQVPEKTPPSLGNGIANNKTVSSTVTVTNGKNSSAKSVTSPNGKHESMPTLIQIGKQNTLGEAALEMTLSKLDLDLELIDSEEEEEEYEVVTEEEVESDEEDDLENPQNFVFAYKKRIVVGDSKSRKVIRDYDTYEEMAVDLKKFFPKIPTKILDKAVKTFNAVEDGPHPFDCIV